MHKTGTRNSTHWQISLGSSEWPYFCFPHTLAIYLIVLSVTLSVCIWHKIFPRLFQNVSLIHGFSVPSGSHLNFSKCLIFLGLLIRHIPLSLTRAFCGVDFLECFGISTNKHLRLSSHISFYVKDLRWLSFYMKRPWHYRAKRNTIFYQSIGLFFSLSSILPLSFLLIHPGKISKSNFSEFSIISGVP